MADIGQLIFDILIFVLPLYFGNAAPTILGGGAPIDGGRYWRDGKRILGDGKTIRGFWMAVLVGILIGAFVAWLVPVLDELVLDSPVLNLTLEYQRYYEYSILKDLTSFLNLSDLINLGLF